LDFPERSRGRVLEGFKINLEQQLLYQAAKRSNQEKIRLPKRYNATDTLCGVGVVARHMVLERIVHSLL